MRPAAPALSPMPRGAASSNCEADMLNPADDALDPGEVPAPTSEGDPLDACSRVVADVAERVGPAVVRVESRGGPRNGQRGGAGSGVVIAHDGLVLTNSHVAAGARQVRVAFPDGGEAGAEVIGDDRDTDLALLRADHRRARLQKPACGVVGLHQVGPVQERPLVAEEQGHLRACASAGACQAGAKGSETTHPVEWEGGNAGPGRA